MRETDEEKAVLDAVTIVSGLPRSGTSMMMQILDAGGIPVLADHIRQADEDNPRGYYEFEPVKTVRDDPGWLDDAGGKVVKMVYRLLYDLPKDRSYRVVFMKRNLEEVIRSQEEMLKRLGKPSGDLSQEKLADIYDRQLRDVMAWLETQPNFSVLYVNYRDVLDDPQRVVHEVNHFLDDCLDVQAMLRVPDRSLHRQKGPASPNRL
jgi:hypothetical protein